MYKLKNMLSAFVDILFPRTCHICSKDIKNPSIAFDSYICSSCALGMKQKPVISCSICGETLNSENLYHSDKPICRACRQTQATYDKLLTCYVYDGTTKELIHKFKYENRPYLAKTISRLMYEQIQNDGISFNDTDYLVPIPLFPARQREREFNQSEQIAQELSITLNIPVVPALKRIRNTIPQASLKSEKRLNNLNGAFRLSKEYNVRNKRLLLIDDVVTTTTTIREASEVLKNSGAKNISVLAFAKG